MAIIKKKLTAIVTENKTEETITIEVKNESGVVVIGPLVHRNMSTRPIDNINEHISQLKQYANIVEVKSSIPGIKTTR